MFSFYGSDPKRPPKPLKGWQEDALAFGLIFVYHALILFLYYTT